jgi:hypothetical protein
MVWSQVAADDEMQVEKYLALPFFWGLPAL